MIDILIIGAGPAGLTAAIYARRADKRVVILEKGAMGGQMTHSPKIENYPGFPALSGNELADKMVEQALALGAEIELAAVTGLEKTADGWRALTTDGPFEAKTVIVAVGAAHRKLGLPGEDETDGISYCAVCDGAFYKGGSVVMVGGGNSAMQEALLLSEICGRVTMVQNLPDLTGEAVLKTKILARKNISVLYNSVCEDLLSERGVFTGVVTRNTETGERKTVFADGLFVAIGLAPDTGAFRGVLELENGCVKAGEDCETSLPGVFVAGDCRTKRIRQVTTAAADGATAALAAIRFLG